MLPAQGTATLLNGSGRSPRGCLCLGCAGGPEHPWGTGCKHLWEEKAPAGARLAPACAAAKCCSQLLEAAGSCPLRGTGQTPQYRSVLYLQYEPQGCSTALRAATCLQERCSALWAQPLDIHSRSLSRGSPKPPRLPQPHAADGAQGYGTAAGEQEPLREPPAPVGVVTLHWCSQAIHRAAGSCQQHEGRVVTRDSSLLMLLQMKM